MPGNTFGQQFRVTTFGESHGKAIGAVIDGCPAGLEISLEEIQKELDRRRPGQSDISSPRKEKDTVEILSGIFEGKSTGHPIGLLICNEDHQSGDYAHLKDSFRPSHADFTHKEKYGHRDHRGGGRSSARETAMRVAAGAIARQLLTTAGIEVVAFVSQVGHIAVEKSYTALDLTKVESNPVRCPDKDTARKMESLIQKMKAEGDTIGGAVTCIIRYCPVGLGEPVFDKLSADLAKAMMSINAVKGFEIGSGFKAATMKGSEHNDRFQSEEGQIRTSTNNSGGIQGGISNGMDIYCKVAFKPVATLMKDQSGVDAAGEEVTLPGKGRHDPCVVPRAVPIVEAMAAIVLADHWLRARLSKI